MTLEYSPTLRPVSRSTPGPFLLSGSSSLSQFAVAEEIATGQLVPLLEELRPRNIEAIHAVFAGGANTPAPVRVFVDFLAECLGNPAAQSYHE